MFELYQPEKMKNKLLNIALLLFLAACNSAEQKKDPKQKEKLLEDEVMTMHEKVMADGETAMQNKMKLDTLLLKKDSIKRAFPTLDTSVENKTMRSLSTQIVKADDAMSDWMHNYNPDFKGKSHEEITKYLEQQKKLVNQINAEYNSVIKASNQYLLKFKK